MVQDEGVEGFKEFLARGNLVELATAVIIGGVFTTVVSSFTDMIMDLLGLFGGVPDFSQVSVAGIGVGAFLSAVLAFLLTSAVVYFFVVLPYNRFNRNQRPDVEDVAASAEQLLTEIRDLLREQSARAAGPGEGRSLPSGQ